MCFSDVTQIMDRISSFEIISRLNFNRSVLDRIYWLLVTIFWSIKLLATVLRWFMQASFTDFYKSQHSEKVNISMIPANINLKYNHKIEVKYFGHLRYIGQIRNEFDIIWYLWIFTENEAAKTFSHWKELNQN